MLEHGRIVARGRHAGCSMDRAPSTARSTTTAWSTARSCSSTPTARRSRRRASGEGDQLRQPRRARGAAAGAASGCAATVRRVTQLLALHAPLRRRGAIWRSWPCWLAPPRTIAGPLVAKQAIDRRHRRPATASQLAAVGGVFVAVADRPAGVRRAADLPDQLGRRARADRPARRPVRAHPAARPRLLRAQPRRRRDLAPDQRRRGAEHAGHRRAHHPASRTPSR